MRQGNRQSTLHRKAREGTLTPIDMNKTTKVKKVKKRGSENRTLKLVLR
jgi:hypothetical protein